jgi:hypothetical protein
MALPATLLPQDRWRLSPHQLTVLTMSTCTARCGHCSVRSSPQRTDVLSGADIRRVIDDVNSVSPLRLVVFAGGEPTLLGDDLLEAIAHADCLGMGTRLVTNGSWAPDGASAKAMITALREAGLTELNISADDFHLPFIPLANVITAWRASKGVGFKSVVIALCSGPGSRLTPEVLMAELRERPQLIYDDAGQQRPLEPPSADGTRYAIANNNVYRIGRGRHLDDRYVRFPKTQDELDRPCPWAVRSPALSPQGHMVACCGIEAENNPVLDFGRSGKQSVTSMFERANRDPVVRAIAALGPMYLMRRALSLRPELRFRDRYSSICEICEDVVTNEAAVAALRGDKDLEVVTELVQILGEDAGAGKPLREAIAADGASV